MLWYSSESAFSSCRTRRQQILAALSKLHLAMKQCFFLQKLHLSEDCLQPRKDISKVVPVNCIIYYVYYVSHFIEKTLQIFLNIIRGLNTVQCNSLKQVL